MRRVQQLVLLGELDSVYQSLTWNGHRGGFAGFVQADYESVQGFHLMVTGETMNRRAEGEPTSFDGWLSAVPWFAVARCRPAARRHLHERGERIGDGGAGRFARAVTTSGWPDFHVFPVRRAMRSTGEEISERESLTTTGNVVGAPRSSATAWSSTVSASMIFPAAVDKDLSLPAMWVEKTVASPQGCLLCHKIQAGGSGTTNAFGGELKQNGAMAENVASLQGALLAVAASDPLAISDIKAGTNPNR